MNGSAIASSDAARRILFFLISSSLSSVGSFAENLCRMCSDPPPLPFSVSMNSKDGVQDILCRFKIPQACMVFVKII